MRPFLAGVWFLVLAGCHAPDKPGGQDVVVRIGDQLHGLETLLQAAGEDKPSGYRIEWSNFVVGPAVIAAQTGGSVDIGWMYETPLVFAQSAGSPIKVIAVAQALRAGESPVALVVRPGSPIRTVADLKGRKVGYLPGTVTQYLVVRLLDRAGLSLKDIQPVTLTSVGPGLLASGTVDAAVTVDPYLSQLLVAGSARILATGGAPLTPDLQYITASDRALADPARKAAIGDLILRVRRALRFRHEHADRATPVYARALGLPEPVIAQYVRRAPVHLVPIGKGIVTAQQTLIDDFKGLGLIQSRPDAGRLFDHRYDALVVKEAGTP